MSRRQFVRITFAGAGLTGGGCGTVLHPERRGQPAGPLDWKIVALDAVGLMLFFVPGVIAFAVDFSTGAIYLPPHPMGRRDASSPDRQLLRVEVPQSRLTIPHLEALVSRHAEKTVDLTAGTYLTEQLERIEDFWETTERLENA